MADAVAGLAVRGQAQILRQDGGVAVSCCEGDGDAGLDAFRPQGARAGVLHARDLHGDGGGAGGWGVEGEVLPGGTGECDGIDAGMIPEALVFQRDGGSGNAGWGWCQPVAVFDTVTFRMAHLRDEGALAVQHHWRRQGRHERAVLPHTDGPEKENQPGQKEQKFFCFFFFKKRSKKLLLCSIPFH